MTSTLGADTGTQSEKSNAVNAAVAERLRRKAMSEAKDRLKQNLDGADLPTLTRALLAVVDECERDIDLCRRLGSSRTDFDIARYRRAKAVMDIIKEELTKGEDQ
jgi:hypothetical protein